MPLPDDYLEQLSVRFLADSLATATRSYWVRRAETLEAARPRPGDFNGRATLDALTDRWDRLTADALECRRHATLFDHDSIDTDLVAEVLGYDTTTPNTVRRSAA